MLYLVGTPIGNTGDLSPRAKEILLNADLVACEDTRRTGLLLSNFGIKAKLFSYHEHNKASKGPVLISMLKDNMTIALVSDAGMPCISDPGADMVKLCIENNIEVSSVPGPVAGMTALALSGLDTRHAYFEFFLPSEGHDRKVRIENLKTIKETIVLYEAPHRLERTIADLIDAGFGDSRAAFCRELTKKYEQVLRFTMLEAREYFSTTAPKGEFVICLEPSNELTLKAELSDDEIVVFVNKCVSEGKSTKETSALLSEMTGKSKKELYAYVVNLLK